jgi:hypothetical protein
MSSARRIQMSGNIYFHLRRNYQFSFHLYYVRYQIFDLDMLLFQEKLPEPGIGRVMALNKPELPLIIGGCICALIVGAVQPLIALIFAEMLGVGCC